MKTLKNKLYQVLSRILTVKEFEAWLYADHWVNSNIPKNELLMELLTINLRRQDAYNELEKFCLKNFELDNTILNIIKLSAHVFWENPNRQNLRQFLENIGRYYVPWDCEFTLCDEIHAFKIEFDIIEEGYYLVEDFNSRFHQFIANLIKQMNETNGKQQKLLLRYGILNQRKKSDSAGVENFYSEGGTQNQKNTSVKRWFQFWK